MRRLIRLIWPVRSATPEPAVQKPPIYPLRHYHPDRLLSHRTLLKMPRVLSQFFIRGRVRPIYLGDHRALCTILARYKFFVDTRNIGFATHLLTDGFWEMWLTEFMVKTIKSRSE